ncbi:MAG TPA: YihY/virulence factor BrkB family protein [Opitutaceae bacterium]|nr:YihY/virulence factor BrkB family protein [Opitutaceae bacterium]
MLYWINKRLAQLRAFWTDGIWKASIEKDHPPRAALLVFMRILSITLTGLGEIRVFSRAAALSFSSMLGIGPLIAIAVLVAGNVLADRKSNIAVDALNKAIRFVAPQVAQLDEAIVVTGETKAGNVEVNPEIVELINNFIEASQSGTLGVVGGLTLVLIVIQLFISVEESFNSIWGVRRGRSMLMRIAWYWTVVTLGAVLMMAALSLLSASTIPAVVERLPLGVEMMRVFRLVAPLTSFFILVLLLTLFYRFIPNTNVYWSPALTGATAAIVLLLLNNYFAFIYVRRVLLSQSLFGSLSIVPVLMAGLYVFWLIVLLGGQITYAVQNVRYRSSQSVWHELNHTSRESLSLLVLVLIARRFKACRPALTASDLSKAIRVPTQVLNECLNRLTDIGLVCMNPPHEGESALDYHYQPAKPLDRITLNEFRNQFAELGESPSGELLEAVDPILRHFRTSVSSSLGEAIGTRTLDQLIDDLPAGPVSNAPAA